MWKTFIAEVKHIFSHKWKIVGFIFMLFIPFLYGFLYMNAYWAPFQHVDKLHVAVVSNDETIDGNGIKTRAGLLVDKLTSKGGLTVANQVYDVEYNQSIKDDPEKVVNSGEYAAVIIIPKGYSETEELIAGFISSGLNKQINSLTPGGGILPEIKTWIATPRTKLLLQKYRHLNDLVSQILAKNPNPSLKDITRIVSVKNMFDAAFKDMSEISLGNLKQNYDRVTFYNSFKSNYLSGEMTNFVSNSNSLVFESTLPISSWIYNEKYVQDLLASLGLSNILSKDNLIHVDKTAPGINSYGYGLSPYFLSIALWAGALVMTFVIKNNRHIKTASTLKHYFGKSLVWVLSGWMQSIILVSAIWLQGINLGVSREWQLYMFALFISTIFTLTVQAIAYTMRYGDLGEFLVVILLVAQLISSSGTFPVEMQGAIFQIIHPIIPFTYSINGIREILWAPDFLVVLRNVGILLIFPIAIIPLSVYINYRFDKKTKNNNKYESFEIHLEDY